MIEIADGKSGRIEGISTSLLLPGYNELLRSTLVGKLLKDIGALCEICVQQLRGPIARPTASALANAAANGGAHEILARLEAGEPVADIVEDLGAKFGRPTEAAGIRKVVEGWPPLHLEFVQRAVQWALGKLDTDDRVTIEWKGDADHPETVTRFELRGHRLLIEFAHPPAALLAGYTAR